MFSFSSIMSHRRGQHENSSNDATAGHSNTTPTTKMSAKDRLRQEEEQLDKLLTGLIVFLME